MFGVQLPRRGLALLFAAGLLAAIGCGGTGDMTGKVTYKEKPVQMGSVLVTASDGSTHTSPISEDGSYSVMSIPQGPVTISVTSQDPKTVVVAQRKNKDAPKAQVTTGDPSKWVAIPAMYGDSKTSGLTATIKGGKNEVPLDLK